MAPLILIIFSKILLATYNIMVIWIGVPPSHSVWIFFLFLAYRCEHIFFGEQFIPWYGGINEPNPLNTSQWSSLMILFFMKSLENIMYTHWKTVLNRSWEREWGRKRKWGENEKAIFHAPSHNFLYVQSKLNTQLQ